jgi:uncharacterized protein
MVESAIYECSIMHHRLSPKVHQFRYNVFYLWLDLDDLDGMAQRLRFFSRNRFNLFSFYDRDHMDHGAGDVKANLLHYLTDKGIDIAPIASIRLLTFPRVLGYIFNPVCFYYAFDAQGQPLHAVAEVTNTFHEQKPYLLSGADPEQRFRLITPKHFYVSPFFALDLLFDFKLRVPDQRLDIRINDRAGDDLVLTTALTGQRRPLSDAGLILCAVKYPLLTLRVIFLIHWHALRLWLKRLPWHRKGANPDLQRDVQHPHPSIASSHQP